jgi:hypothetical protein
MAHITHGMDRLLHICPVVLNKETFEWEEQDAIAPDAGVSEVRVLNTSCVAVLQNGVWSIAGYDFIPCDVLVMVSPAGPTVKTTPPPCWTTDHGIHFQLKLRPNEGPLEAEMPALIEPETYAPKTSAQKDDCSAD